MARCFPTRRSTELGDIIAAGGGDNLVSGDALSTGNAGSTPTATADNTATTTMTGTDGAEGFAVSSAGDDGIGSPFGGILGAPTGGGFRSDEHTAELQALMRLSYSVFRLHNK